MQMLPRAALLARAVLAASVAGALAAGCAGEPRASAAWLSVREVTPSAFERLEARDPAVAADGHGRAALTWVTRDSAGSDLWLALSSDSGVTFGAPARVNLARGRVSSTREGRPVATYGPSGQLAIAWSERRGHSGPGGDLVLRASSDGGATLSPAVRINDDRESGPDIFHGFPALEFLPDGSLFAAWIDERRLPHARREAKDAHGEDEVRSALFGSLSHDGGQTWATNRVLESEVCPCCRPTVATAGNAGIALGWRDARDDLRDPMLAVSTDQGLHFAAAVPVSPDRWHLRGCPAVGPASSFDAVGGGHYAWYTGAAKGGVFIVPWRAAGGVAGIKRALLDSLSSATHPRLAALGPSTLIAVEGRAQEDSAHSVLAVRVLESDGTFTPWVFLGADASGGWIAALDSRSALACWMEKRENGNRVRVAKLTRTARGR